MFGKAYLQFQATYFPELGWTDFVALILDSCLKVVSGLRDQRHGRVLFMDGPLTLDFTRIAGNRLEIAGKRSSSGGETVVLTAQTGYRSFIETLLSAAESVLRISDKHGWLGLRDVESLRRRVTRLSKAAPKARK